MAVLIDDALFFCTGADERKARNLESNPHVAMTTGSGPINQGRDLVVEGKAVRVTDEATLRRAVERYRSKYGWSFDVAGDVIRSADGGGDAYLFRVQPRQAFGFGKGEPYSQTRWTFR
jgi:hypothetical protein